MSIISWKNRPNISIFRPGLSKQRVAVRQFREQSRSKWISLNLSTQSAQSSIMITVLEIQSLTRETSQRCPCYTLHKTKSAGHAMFNSLNTVVVKALSWRLPSNRALPNHLYNASDSLRKSLLNWIKTATILLAFLPPVYILINIKYNTIDGKW